MADFPYRIKNWKTKSEIVRYVKERESEGTVKETL